MRELLSRPIHARAVSLARRLDGITLASKSAHRARRPPNIDAVLENAYQFRWERSVS